MATSFVAVRVVGNFRGCPTKHGDLTYWHDRQLVEEFGKQLPNSWTAGHGAGDEVDLYFVIPHRSRKELGKHVADFLAYVDRDFEGYLAHNRFILADLGQDRNRNGRCIFDGDGMELGNLVRFWTGVDWMNRRPPKWESSKAFDDLLMKSFVDDESYSSA
jgi:hypothetical protein